MRGIARLSGVDRSDLFREVAAARHLQPAIVEKDFWENNVLARVIPDPDGSKAYDDALASYFDAKKETVIPLVGFDADLARRKELTSLISKMETEKKTIDQKIKLFMQENEVAENSKYRVTWKMSDTTGSRRFVVKEAA